MSLTSLRAKKVESEQKIENLGRELVSTQLFESAKYRVTNANLRIVELDKELDEQRNKRVVAKGLMGTIFGSKEQPQSAIERIKEIRQEKSAIQQSLTPSETLVSKQRYTSQLLEKEKEWLTKVLKRISTLEEREARTQALKNKAAETSKAKRRIAHGVKKGFLDNTECPYCGDTLMSVTHADHIYPVAKGGESTKRNMVLVCAECNSKKSSLTLQAFIKKFSLDRSEIERRLEMLGKDF